MAVFLAGSLGPFGGTAHRRTEEGNRRYEAQEYHEALRAYTEAQVELPESPELFYDLGNVLYRQDDLDGAEEAWTRAMVEAGPELLADIAHNLGNSRYRRQAYQEAVEAYSQSLAARPDDMDTKRNLELALRQLQASEQQKQDPESGDQKDKKDEKGENKEQNRPPDDRQENDEEHKNRPEQEPSSGEMTKEEAERLLDSLEAEEKENRKEEEKRKAAAAGNQREKDW